MWNSLADRAHQVFFGAVGTQACFCQFKIDQARQLNFDQGLKPVF